MVPDDDGIEPLDLNVSPETIIWQDEAKAMFAPQLEYWQHSHITYSLALKMIEDFVARLGGDVEMVGHNVGFDMSFLKQLHPDGDLPKGVSHRSIDTYSIACTAYKLSGTKAPRGLTALLADAGIAIDDRVRHTAAGDALATKQLYRFLMGKIESK